MKKIDLPLFLAVFFMVIFGILMVYNASSFEAFTAFKDKYHFLKEQSLWASFGFMLLFIAYRLDYHFWYKMALPLLILSTLLLLVLFIPGRGIVLLGARRWLDLGFITFQPSELTKLSLIIYLSAWFCRKEKGRIWAFLLLFAVIIGLVMFQPDMGTAIVLASSSLILYFLSGPPIVQFLLLFPALGALGAFLIIKEPYRFSRLLTFLNVDRDPLGASYHIRQALIALGAGGLTGVGLGQSLQKYSYLPESTTDSIFAIIAEELGFVGALIIILIFIFIILRGIRIATRTKDQFGRLLALGITSFLAIQIIINLSALVALIPLTGVPLPFISYGGSSLITSLLSVGILLNISGGE